MHEKLIQVFTSALSVEKFLFARYFFNEKMRSRGKEKRKYYLYYYLIEYYYIIYTII